MKRFALLFMLTMAATCAPSFPQQPQTAQQAPATAKVDCLKMGESPLGCDSFIEMLEKGDSAIVERVRPNHYRQTLVCFRPHEDTFLLISYTNRAFSPATGDGFVDYDKYENGVRTGFHTCTGKWRKDDKWSFLGVRCWVDDSEITLSYSFENLARSKTNYEIKIRRSTLRFTETFEGDSRAILSTPKRPVYQETKSGYCAELNAELK